MGEVTVLSTLHAGRAAPQAEQSTACVEVTPADREAGVTPPRVPSLDARAARAVQVMRQHNAFLADTSHTTEPPDREALMQAHRDAEEFILERLVVGA